MKNEMDRLVPQQIVALAQFCQAAMLILNARMFTTTALFMAFSLFAWGAYKMEYQPIVAACAFSVLVFIPVQRMQARKEIVTTQSNEGE